jgi:hypothetical protein
MLSRPGAYRGRPHQRRAWWRRPGLFGMEKLFRPDGPCAHGHVPTPAIVCSQDSGAIWTKPQAFDVGGDFPRIAVGSDGSVYAVSITVDASKITLTRFSSCANGLAKQFSTELFINLDVFCPVSGLDRCNIPMLVNPTVAVDDTDPNHIYIAYASTGGSSVQNIRVTDSTDGGRTFLRSVQLNANIAARRSCPGSASQAELPTSLGMIRPAPTAGANDLTSFYLGSAFVNAGSLQAKSHRQCGSAMRFRISLRGRQCQGFQYLSEPAESPSAGVAERRLSKVRRL